MKVLLAHNFYQSSSPSGEDVVYRNEAELLKSRAVEVVSYERHNDDISGTFGKIEATFSMVWSKKTYHEVTALINKEKPDLAHFHNIWYLISPSAYYACRDAGVPVVQTLHNFRIFCANGLLLRDGKVCNDCLGRPPWRGVLHGCFRGSRFSSLPVAITEAFHQFRRTWTDRVDAYIALTDFGRNKLIECGLPGEKIFVKPNFLQEPANSINTSRDYAVFIGRLSQEKGVDVLIDSLKSLESSNPRSLKPFSLKVIGDGPLRHCLEEKVRDQGLKQTVDFLGKRPHVECMQLLREARFLIVPSICYENFPLTIVEAFACGKPVLASSHGAMGAIVEHEKTGLLFPAGDSRKLAETLSIMMSDADLCVRMGRNARLEYENRYTAQYNFEHLMKIYGHVLQNRS